MYFMILGSDGEDGVAIRARIRPEHRHYLRHHGVPGLTVLMGGPTLADDGEAMNGTLLVVEADALETVHRFVAGDPYTRAGLFRAVDIRPWSWSLGQPERG
ncbi:MAG: YciI family protein [Lautropia sp.]|nr:YciI family protein [Lautropia sp.]